MPNTSPSRSIGLIKFLLVSALLTVLLIAFQYWLNHPDYQRGYAAGLNACEDQYGYPPPSHGL